MTIDPDALRMYIIFRADLPEMTRAKGEVQAGHAAASLIYRGMSQAYPRLIEDYMGEFDKAVHEGQAKIVMEVADEAALHALAARASDRNVPYVLIQDAAHTIFDKPTVTCIGIGPCTKKDGNNVTRNAGKRV